MLFLDGKMPLLLYSIVDEDSTQMTPPPQLIERRVKERNLVPWTLNSAPH